MESRKKRQDDTSDDEERNRGFSCWFHIHGDPITVLYYIFSKYDQNGNSLLRLLAIWDIRKNTHPPLKFMCKEY